MQGVIIISGLTWLNSEAGMRIQRDLQNYKTTTFIKYVILESLVFFVAIY